MCTRINNNNNVFSKKKKYLCRVCNSYLKHIACGVGYTHLYIIYYI